MNRFLIRLAISIIAVLVAIVGSIVAVGYFTIALFLFLLTYVAPALAALFTGIGILVIAGAIIVAARMSFASARRLPSGKAETAAQIGGMLGRKMHAYAKSHKGPAAAIAILLGFAVGVSPKLREFLRELLKA